jgi:hypothetical protein
MGLPSLFFFINSILAPNMLAGKKILIGITGSIAAYKIPVLVRLLIKEGAEVRVVMTRAAADFVSQLTLSTLSRSPVLIDLFDEQCTVGPLGRPDAYCPPQLQYLK